MSRRKWDRARDLSRFCTTDYFDQQALRFLYNSKVNGRTLVHLSEDEIYRLVQRNGTWDSRGGPQIYVNSFGAVPVLFCAPYATVLYTEGGEKIPHDPLSMKFVYSLAKECGGTAIFPVCRINHPRFIERGEFENPLVAAITRVIEEKHLLLFIEVYSAEWDAKGYFEIPENATLGWPEFETEFRQFLPHIDFVYERQKTRPGNVEVRERYLSKPLFCTMVRKQYAIPAVALHLAKGLIEGFYYTDREGDVKHQNAQDTLADYQRFLDHAKERIPDITAYCQFERQHTGIAALHILYRRQYSTKDTQPLLPLVSPAPALSLPSGSENGVVDAASIEEVLDSLYARYNGGGQ